MSGEGVLLLLVVVVGGALLSLIIWQIFRTPAPENDSLEADKQVDLLFILLILGAFALGAFLTYALVIAF
jgi:hypothetical protein